MTEICSIARKLLDEHLTVRSWGNLSQRMSAKHFLITPSGRNYIGLTDQDLVPVDLTGHYPSGMRPSSELGLHLAIYRQFSDANFILHTHQFWASAFACTGRAWEIEDATLNQRLGSKRLPINHYKPAGSVTLHHDLVDILQKSQSRAILMAHHGLLIYGASAEECFQLAMDLEAFLSQLAKPWGMRTLDTGRPLAVFQRPEPTQNPRVIKIFQQKPLCRIVMEDQDPLFQLFSTQGLAAYLEDFAQIAGPLACDDMSNDLLICDGAAYYCGADLESIDYLRLIVEKNILAAQLALQFGVLPLNRALAQQFRKNYVESYALAF